MIDSFIQSPSDKAWPSGLPPEHLDNLAEAESQLDPQAPRRDSHGAMRLMDRREDADPRTTKVSMLTLDFCAAAPDLQQPDREWQTIGTMRLMKGLGTSGNPDWVDLLCLAREGHKYTVLQVLLEDVETDDEDDQDGGPLSRLVFHREPGSAFTAADLSGAFERRCVVGAQTPADDGVFVVLVFNLR